MPATSGKQSEKSIELAIRRKLEASGWYVVKIHGGPMQKAGLPDLLCLKYGCRPHWIEVKRPGGKPTRLQESRFLELTGAGCDVHVADSVDSVRFML